MDEVWEPEVYRRSSAGSSGAGADVNPVATMGGSNMTKIRLWPRNSVFCAWFSYYWVSSELPPDEPPQLPRNSTATPRNFPETRRNFPPTPPSFPAHLLGPPVPPATPRDFPATAGNPLFGCL